MELVKIFEVGLDTGSLVMYGTGFVFVLVGLYFLLRFSIRKFNENNLKSHAKEFAAKDTAQSFYVEKFDEKKKLFLVFDNFNKVNKFGIGKGEWKSTKGVPPELLMDNIYLGVITQSEYEDLEYADSQRIKVEISKGIKLDKIEPIIVHPFLKLARP